MDKEAVIAIVKKYAELAAGLMEIKKVILYGSYAYGNPKPASDIDDRIEPILLNEKNDKSGFLEELQKSGILVYGC
jgi:predicted nucleotidyltransferase